MKSLSLFITLLIAFINITAVEAKAYRWVGKNGNVHFSDRKPQGKSKLKARLVKINRSRGSLPDADLKKPIKYTKSTPSMAIKLGEFELKLPGADYRDVKIGQLYSGARCQNKKGDLLWVQGNGYMDDARMGKVLVSEFNRAGYRLYRETTGLSQLNSHLLLTMKLVELKLNRCTENTSFRKQSKDEAYLKINWVLEDSLSRKILFNGHSAGVYKGLSQPAREGGTAQAIDRALVVAANNILADRKMVKFFKQSAPILAQENAFKTLPLNIKYSKGKHSFKKKIKQLQKSTVTIRTTKGHGSGVFITKEGLILTNAHVVGDEKQVLVILDNKKEVKADVIRVEPIRDIALLKVRKKMKVNISEVSLKQPQVGDTFFVIGTPLSEDFSHTVTSGILSAKRSNEGLDYYQTDASINKGNSGGPIYNDAGELVAISVSAIFSKTGVTVGLNYLIPIEDAFDALNISRVGANQLAQSKKTVKPKKHKSSVKMKKPKVVQLTKDVLESKKIFNLYKKALKAKRRGQFNTAKGLLKNAVRLIPKNNQSDNAKLIRDELYYSLPLSHAISAIKNKQPDIAAKQIRPLEIYASNHPKRFTYLKKISDVKESIKYLREAMNMLSRADVKRGLDFVRIFLVERYAETGELPDSRYALTNVLDERFGSRLSNEYEVQEYEPQENSFKIVFIRLSNNTHVTISQRF